MYNIISKRNLLETPMIHIEIYNNISTITEIMYHILLLPKFNVIIKTLHGIAKFWWPMIAIAITADGSRK